LNSIASPRSLSHFQEIIFKSLSASHFGRSTSALSLLRLNDKLIEKEGVPLKFLIYISAVLISTIGSAECLLKTPVRLKGDPGAIRDALTQPIMRYFNVRVSKVLKMTLPTRLP